MCKGRGGRSCYCCLADSAPLLPNQPDHVGPLTQLIQTFQSQQVQRTKRKGICIVSSAESPITTLTCFLTDAFLQDAAKQGTRGHRKVTKAFGREILLPDGELDRQRLGDLVFQDPAMRKKLNRCSCSGNLTSCFHLVM
jgi:hypothetical protein